MQREGSSIFAGPSREAQKVQHCKAAHARAVEVAKNLADPGLAQSWILREDRKDRNRGGGGHGLSASWAGSVAEKYERGTVGRSSYVSSVRPGSYYKLAQLAIATSLPKEHMADINCRVLSTAGDSCPRPSADVAFNRRIASHVAGCGQATGTKYGVATYCWIFWRNWS